MTPKRRIIPVFVPHLGCPHDCVFCNQRRISGAAQPATADTVREAVERAGQILPKDGERELAFYGGSFTAIPEVDQEKLLGAAHRYTLSGDIHRIRLSTRPDCIDDDVLARLRRYGVTTVELGVQSMCPDVLAMSN
jgi:histone acetyltransferase (RNA polymerase elongator complex component)